MRCHVRGSLAGQRDREHELLRAGRQRRVTIGEQLIEIAADVDVDRRVRALPRAHGRDQPPRQHADHGGVALRRRRDRRGGAGGSGDIAGRGQQRGDIGRAQRRQLQRFAERVVHSAGARRRHEQHAPRRGSARPEASRTHLRRGPRPARHTAGALPRALPAPLPSPPRASPRRGGDPRRQPRPGLRAAKRSRASTSPRQISIAGIAPAAPATATSRATTSNNVRRPDPGAPTSSNVEALAAPSASLSSAARSVARSVRRPTTMPASGSPSGYGTPRSTSAGVSAPALRRTISRSSSRALPGRPLGSADSRRANSPSQPSPSPGRIDDSTGAGLAQHALHRRQTTAERRRAAPRLVQRGSQREQIDGRRAIARQRLGRRIAQRAARPAAPRGRRTGEAEVDQDRRGHRRPAARWRDRRRRERCRGCERAPAPRRDRARRAAGLRAAPPRRRCWRCCRRPRPRRDRWR